MISYNEAIGIINRISLRFSDERISILKSLNRITSENILSPSKNPSANNSAFDGFAVLAKETKGLNKKKTKKFKILKIIAAGDNPKLNNYKNYSTVEVMTGGLIPRQYDSIIPVEKAKYFPSKQKPTHIIVDEKVKKYSHHRFAGEDYNLRDVVINKGEVIEPKHIMAFTALGIKEIKVKKKPKIIFFGTGNEIVDYKKKIIPSWKVRNSNNYYFKAFAETFSLEIIDGGTIRDNEPKKLKNSLKKFLKSDINLFVTSGAISAGKYDFIPKLIKDYGFKKCFKGVAIKPGRPIMLSKLRDKLFFGLPGNPISCAAGFRFFIYPLMRKILGMSKENTRKAKLSNSYSKRKNFTHFSRCLVKINKKGQHVIEVLDGQQSNRIHSFVKSNSWGIFSERKKFFNKGNQIKFVPLS